ncbi:5'-AMP-activated protein kinase subunit beta-2 [Coelomomyces lativittatus]|nr:5'-AMP-activated protein kinase subunit beta-2 [Coelomomyces lativittatus]
MGNTPSTSTLNSTTTTTTKQEPSSLTSDDGYTSQDNNIHSTTVPSFPSFSTQPSSSLHHHDTSATATACMEQNHQTNSWSEIPPTPTLSSPNFNSHENHSSMNVILPHPSSSTLPPNQNLMVINNDKSAFLLTSNSATTIHDAKTPLQAHACPIHHSLPSELSTSSISLSLPSSASVSVNTSTVSSASVSSSIPFITSTSLLSPTFFSIAPNLSSNFHPNSPFYPSTPPFHSYSSSSSFSSSPTSIMDTTSSSIYSSTAMSTSTSTSPSHSFYTPLSEPKVPSFTATEMDIEMNSFNSMDCPTPTLNTASTATSSLTSSVPFPNPPLTLASSYPTISPSLYDSIHPLNTSQSILHPFSTVSYEVDSTSTISTDLKTLPSLIPSSSSTPTSTSTFCLLSKPSNILPDPFTLPEQLPSDLPMGFDMVETQLVYSSPSTSSSLNRSTTFPMYVVGSWNQWQTKIKLTYQAPDQHVVTLHLSPGTYTYKYMDSQGWLSPQEDPLVYFVTSKFGQSITLWNDDQPPPLVPIQLTQFLFRNSSMNGMMDQLSLPNHVNLNHVYTCKLETGLMAMGLTSRYRSKYITLVFYQPISSDHVS